MEAYARLPWRLLRTVAALKQGATSSLRQLPDWENLSAKDVYEAAAANDAFALRIVDETAFYLGIGVTSAVHAIDPGLVLLGGAMNFGGSQCNVGKRFLQGIVDEFGRRTFPNVFEGTKIDFATLGGDAGYISRPMRVRNAGRR